MGTIVYHYTSLNGLFSILSNKTFWLMDLRSSMDKNDIIYGEKVVKHFGMECYNTEMPNFAYAQNYYALSCAKERDSYFHFNNYGDCCKGVSIGINTDFIKDGINNNAFAKSLQYFLNFEKVIYDTKEQEDFLKKYFFNETTITQYKGTPFEFINDIAFTNAFTNAMSLFKRNEFHLEQEIRFVYKQDIKGSKTRECFNYNGKEYWTDNFMTDVLHLEGIISREPIINMQWISNHGRIRKYYNFNYEPFGIDNVIRSITLGPLCEQSIDVLKEFCRSKGSNPQIYKSEIELR